MAKSRETEERPACAVEQDKSPIKYSQFAGKKNAPLFSS
jgi:hypothetical protein